MANYQRYQTLSSAEQYLFSPTCPIWVSRYQISWDTQTGGRLLQCRMVNVSEKSVTAVYLRVLCRDAQGQDITTLHLLPMTGLFVAPGDVFGDDKILTLWPNRTAFAEIFAERVCFSDGTAWNEQTPTDYLAIPAPAVVHPQDRAYPRLALAAREGGVRNDCYFRALRNVWLCTCGVPNANQTLHCRHCGADRTWLEQHMDPEAIFAPPPAPEPEPEPAPAPVTVPEPEPIASPEERFDLASYLTAEPMTVPAAPMYPEAPAEPEPEPEPPVEDAPVRHTGRTVAIVLAVLLFLGVGAWFAYRQLLAPYLQYEQAIAAENSGDYIAAIEIYQTLGDYQDSPARIAACQAQLALDQMRQGNYAEAYAMLKDLDGYENYAADCVYSMGVISYNASNYETAWEYVELLERDYPNYENTAQLRECCCYGFGKQKLELAEQLGKSAEAMAAYDEAKQWFLAAGDYSNSAEMARLCDYEIADLTANLAAQGDDATGYIDAANQFAALGDYSDSTQRRLECMFDYCAAVADLADETCANYLTELLDADYAGAEALRDSLVSYEVTVDLLLRGSDSASLENLTVETMQKLAIQYKIEGGFHGSTMQLVVSCTLPGCPSETFVLNADGSSEGEALLYDLCAQRAKEAGPMTLRFIKGGTGEVVEAYTVEIKG